MSLRAIWRLSSNTYVKPQNKNYRLQIRCSVWHLKKYLNPEPTQHRDTEIKFVLRSAMTDKVNDREIYMKGIDHSYYYERYTSFKTDEL